MFLKPFSSKFLLFKRFENKIFNNIVYSYVPQRNPFDKTSYIKNYVPRPNKYHKTRKPRLEQWTNPKIEWPILLPAPTRLTGKALIKTLESQEKKRIRKQRNFKIVKVRQGDVVQFKYYHSLSEKKFNIYSGIVLGRTKKNSLDASIRVIFRFCGTHVEMNLKLNSPFLGSFKILARGQGRRRGKLYYLSKFHLTKEELLRPLIKGKKITYLGKKKKVKKHEPLLMNTIDDPLLKPVKTEEEEEQQKNKQEK